MGKLLIIIVLAVSFYSCSDAKRKPQYQEMSKAEYEHSLTIEQDTLPLMTKGEADSLVNLAFDSIMVNK